MELPADEPPGTPWSDRGMAYHFFDGTSWVSNPDYQDANNIARVDAARNGLYGILENLHQLSAKEIFRTLFHFRITFVAL
jgi:hypothetical protein